MKKLLLTIGCNLSLPRDILAHLYYRWKYRKGWERAKSGASQLRQWARGKRDPQVDRELCNRFKWTAEKWDWRPLTLEMICARNFMDDCDCFAQLAHFMYGDGERVVIWPNRGNLRPDGKQAGFHMVYVRGLKVYSSGDYHRMSLKEYLEASYPEGAVVARQWI